MFKKINVFLFILVIFASFTSVTFAADIDELGNETFQANYLSIENYRSDNIESGSFSDLETDIGNTAENGTLNFDKDYVWKSNDSKKPIIIDKSITINGNGHTIDAKGQTSIFKIINSINVVLNNITFINGNSSTGMDGGVIYQNGGCLTVSGCNFTKNYGDYYGGAIYTENAYLTVCSSDFTNNSAAYSGGAIYAYGSSVNVDKCNFNMNHAENSDGGDIYIEGPSWGGEIP